MNTKDVDRIKRMLVLLHREDTRHFLAVRRIKDRFDPGWFSREALAFALVHPEFMKSFAAAALKVGNKE